MRVNDPKLAAPGAGPAADIAPRTAADPAAVAGPASDAASRTAGDPATVAGLASDAASRAAGSRHAVLVDFGSTYTKMAVCDLRARRIVTTAKFPSTVATDASIALSQCYDAARSAIGAAAFDAAAKIASSSAAGGLRMAVSGLSRSLSIEAGRSAAFGAGAKILRTFSGRLKPSDIEDLSRLPVEILLVTGGYDHGNRTAVLANCELLASAPIHMPIVFAGNCDVAPDVRRMLTFAGKEFYIVPNILPSVGVVNSAPVEDIIRDLFLKRIVNMKGLDKVTGLLDRLVMPTPKAVLSACELLSIGPGRSTGTSHAGAHPSEDPTGNTRTDGPAASARTGGLGDLLVVDVGGATTDIHSCCEPRTYNGAKQVGTPPPYTRRTVEGDLGMRESSDTLLKEAGIGTASADVPSTNNHSGTAIATGVSVGSAGIASDIGNLTQAEITAVIDRWHETHEALPSTDAEAAVDRFLAENAVRISARRHAGRIEPTVGSEIRYVQHGKNLTGIRTVIGTGGPLIFSGYGRDLLKQVLRDPDREPDVLLPADARILLDEDYIFFAAGLLREIDEAAAFEVMLHSLRI